MKSIYSFKLAVIICFSFVSICCQKQKEQEILPPATSEGKHTFGCKIDGVTWIPNGVHEIYGTSMSALSAFVGVHPLTHKFYIHISAIKDHDDGVESLSMMVNADSAGTYLFNGSLQNGYSYPAYASFSKAGYFSSVTDSVYTGKLVLTKVDERSRIISGTFEFRSIDKNSGRVFTITEGRFDARTP
jgi:hypothetical protein